MPEIEEHDLREERKREPRITVLSLSINLNAYKDRKNISGEILTDFFRRPRFQADKAR